MDTHELACNVISNIYWHSNDEMFRIYNDREDCVERDLTKEELSAVVSNEYPLRIVADSFDNRAFLDSNLENAVEYVRWTVVLKPGATIQNILDVVKRMPVYGYWECDRPVLEKRESRFVFRQSELTYTLKLFMGT